MNPALQGWDDDQVANVDLLQLVAAAADLCRKPWRHAVLPADGHAAEDTSPGTLSDEDCCLRLEVRDGEGARQPMHDLELELYRSGGQLNLTLAWAADGDRPILWHGSHPVWMASASGERCERPEGGQALEALARRLRSLLA